MASLRFLARISFTAAMLTAALPALAQQQPNVSDITGPNVSDITGPNVSDITGTSPDDARARRAVAAGLDSSSVEQLAEDLGTTYDVCVGGGDCSSFYTLLEQSNDILRE